MSRSTAITGPRRHWPRHPIHAVLKIKKPGGAAWLFVLQAIGLGRYCATRNCEIDVPICLKAAAIWLGSVSMKKLLGPLAQAGRTADCPAPSVSICTAKMVTPPFLILVHRVAIRA